MKLTKSGPLTDREIDWLEEILMKYGMDDSVLCFSELDGLLTVKWHTEFGHLNRGDMLTSEQHRCSNEKKKFQRRV